LKFTETPLAGCFVITHDRRDDERGFFARTFCREAMAEHGCATTVAQTSMATNHHRGTLRGLHVLLPDPALPHHALETKLVRCTRGAVFDVLVDLRAESATFGQSFGVTLDAEQHQSVYVAAGVAHGYQVLKAQTDLHYMMSVPYGTGIDSGVRWNDPSLAIAWPLPEEVTVSERDAALPTLAQWQSQHH